MPGDADRLALAVGISPLNVAEGRVTGHPRNRVTLASFGRERLAVPPDETVTRAALSNGSRDAARMLTDALLTAFRTSDRGSF